MKEIYLQTEEKLNALRDIIRELGSAAVAFSGGVDSTFLLKVAHDELGERCVAVTAFADSMPARERAEAEEFCRRNGIRQIIFHSEEMQDERYLSNPPDRCYYCKRGIFEEIIRTAEREHLHYVIEGSNMDDDNDFRPGMRALREFEVRSPLKETGLYKEEIRQLSRQMGLPTWNKPSFACLASRIPYGQWITTEKLSMIERAEQFLAELGFRQYRVRVHGEAKSEGSQFHEVSNLRSQSVLLEAERNRMPEHRTITGTGMLARIEVPAEEIPRLTEPEIRAVITARFREIGFFFITVDLEGYRTGSLNVSI